VCIPRAAPPFRAMLTKSVATEPRVTSVMSHGPAIIDPAIVFTGTPELFSTIRHPAFAVADCPFVVGRLRTAIRCARIHGWGRTTPAPQLPAHMRPATDIVNVAARLGVPGANPQIGMTSAGERDDRSGGEDIAAPPRPPGRERCRSAAELTPRGSSRGLRSERLTDPLCERRASLFSRFASIQFAPFDTGNSMRHAGLLSRSDSGSGEGYRCTAGCL
jgi:hypothetical protein